ncbi:hypothetical protein AYO41_00865 [Verrucomicrobia bacterium SCGC AG-212-E04]|nr:hypothetical protein AYO41_00865 [Verrucomicrobia bacterium SCGC AG-212-E04]
MFSYLRGTGRNVDDAKDLTQAFFEHLIEHETIKRARREKGRFRTFLLGTLKFFLTDLYRHSSRQKRGGGQPILSIDDTAFPSEYSTALSHQEPPDVQFERTWMQIVFRRAFESLRHQFAAKGKLRTFDALSVFLTDDSPDVSYADKAKQLNATESAVKSAIHRLRAAYADEVKLEIARTVDTPEDAEDELRRFHSVFAGLHR